jgi:hypothetical protein
MFLADDKKNNKKTDDSFTGLVEDFVTGFKQAADKEEEKKKEKKQDKKLDDIKKAVDD